MAEQKAPPEVDPYRVAPSSAASVVHYQIGPDQLAGLIGEVHQALAGLGRAAPPLEEALKPGSQFAARCSRIMWSALNAGTMPGAPPKFATRRRSDRPPAWPGSDGVYIRAQIEAWHRGNNDVARPVSDTPSEKPITSTRRAWTLRLARG